MEDYLRINSMEELENLKNEKKRDIDILITKEFKFPESCYILFEDWMGNIAFEKGIDTSNVKNMNSMFFGAKGKIEGLEYFDTSNVEDMNSMFDNILNIDIDINDWDVSKVKDMSYMFFTVTIDDLDISNWNISKDCEVECMFKFRPEDIMKLTKKDITEEKVIEDNIIEDKEEYELSKPRHYEIKGLGMSSEKLLSILLNNYIFLNTMIYFYLGNLFKYLFRFTRKNKLEDLKKAKDYMNALYYSYEKEIKENEQTQ